MQKMILKFEFSIAQIKQPKDYTSKFLLIKDACGWTLTLNYYLE